MMEISVEAFTEGILQEMAMFKASSKKGGCSNGVGPLGNMSMKYSRTGSNIRGISHCFGLEALRTRATSSNVECRVMGLE